MPRIESRALRDLARRLSDDGKLDKKDVDALVDDAMQDGALSVTERAELVEILGTYADRLDSPETRQRLEAFLTISDSKVRSLATELERDDGVIDVADADQLNQLVDEDGHFAENRAFSLGAMMVGAKLTPEARTKLQEKIDQVGPTAPLGNLGDIEGQTVVIGADGRIGMGAPPADSAAELRAVIQLALKVDPGTDPFAGVTDKTVLSKIASALQDAHASFLPGPDTSGAAQLEQRQGRAAALKLLEAAALRAHELGDPALTDKIAHRLVRAAVAEPFRGLRDFTLQRYDGNAADGLLPKNPEATEAVFPPTPPYAKWLQDNTIKIHYVCDNDGTPISGTVSYFRRLGFQAKQQDDKSWDLSYPARAGSPAVKVNIPAPPPDGGEPELFNKMDDDSVDMIVYSGHAGYGRRVDAALRGGVDGTGDGKLVVLLQCWGEGNLETLENAFPDAQVLSTTDSTTDYIDHMMFTRLLNGVLDRDGWDTIGGAIRDELKDRLGNSGRYEDKDWDRHFFFPNTRELMLNAFDRDRDSVIDVVDPIFNVVYPKRQGLVGGYDPVVQEIPSYALDGTGFSQALDTLSLVFRYEEMLPADAAARVPWSPDAVVSDGFFTPVDGDTRAFRFKIEGDRLHVGVSTRFAHTSEEDLTRMLAVEAGQFLGEAAGLDQAGQVGMSLCMLERAIKQQGEWYYEEGVLDTQRMEESMIFSRYGMEGMRFEDISAASALGDHDHFTPDAFNKVVDMVRARPGLADAAGRAPSLVGTPVTVPDGVSFPDSWIEQAHVEEVVKQLGIDGAVVSFSPDWLEQGVSSAMAITLRTADGEAQVLSLGLDALGSVERGATIGIDLEGATKARVADYAKDMAQNHQLDSGALMLAYEQARADGADAADALGALFRATRMQLPVGSEVWDDAYPLYELLSPDEKIRAESVHDRLFDWDVFEAERLVFGWIEGIGGVDVEPLKRAYLDALISDGMGAALSVAVQALPDHVAPPDFALVDSVSQWGLEPDEARQLLKVVKAKTGLQDADLILRAMAEGEGDSGGQLIEDLGQAAIDAGKGPGEVVCAVLEGFHAELDGLPWYSSWGELQAYGLLSDADIVAIDAKVMDLGGHV